MIKNSLNNGLNEYYPAMINTFMSTNPSFSFPIYIIGYNLLINKQYYEAKYYFNRALNIDERMIESQLSLRLLYNKINAQNDEYYKINLYPKYEWEFDEKKSEDDYNELIFNIYSWAINHYYDRNFFPEIINLIKKYIEKDKYISIKYILYAIKARFILLNSYLNYNNSNFLKKSDELYKRSIEFSNQKNNSAAWGGRAEVNYLLGNTDNAIEYALNAVKMNDSYSYVYTVLGNILINSGDYYGYKYINEAVKMRIKMYKTYNNSDDIKNILIEKILELKNCINISDIYRTWKYSCYYFGYCPEHPHLKTYIILRENKRIIISHYYNKRLIQHS